MRVADGRDGSGCPGNEADERLLDAVDILVLVNENKRDTGAVPSQEPSGSRLRSSWHFCRMVSKSIRPREMEQSIVLAGRNPGGRRSVDRDLYKESSSSSARRSAGDVPGHASRAEPVGIAGRGDFERGGTVPRVRCGAAAGQGKMSGSCRRRLPTRRDSPKRSSRSFISAAALLVKVTARQRRACSRRAVHQAIRRVSVWVFPVPGPATMSRCLPS